MKAGAIHSASCAKEKVMIEFAKNLKGARLLRLGRKWQDKSERTIERLQYEEDKYEREQAQYEGWDEGDWADHYSASDDSNLQALGRMMSSANDVMKEVDAETEELRNWCEKRRREEDEEQMSSMNNSALKSFAEEMFLQAVEMEKQALGMLSKAAKMKIMAQLAIESLEIEDDSDNYDVGDEVPF